MNIQTETSYLNVDVVYSCVITSKPIITVVKKSFWPWEKDEIKEEQSWVLTMSYLSSTGERYEYTTRCGDHGVLKTQFDSIMKQIKDQDSSYADKLLEEAIINGGTK